MQEVLKERKKNIENILKKIGKKQKELNEQLQRLDNLETTRELTLEEKETYIELYNKREQNEHAFDSYYARQEELKVIEYLFNEKQLTE